MLETRSVHINGTGDSHLGAMMAAHAERLAGMTPDNKKTKIVTADPFIDSVREQSQLRLMDRVARGLPACCHDREDGLGFCGEGPEAINHQPGPHSHTFKPTLKGALGTTALLAKGHSK